MIFKTEAEAHVKRKFILEENTHKAYSLVLVNFTELPKRKINHKKRWSEASTKFDVLKLIKIIKSIIFKFEYQKYLPLQIHQANKNLNNMYQGNIYNAHYLEKIIITGRTWHFHSRDNFMIKP